MVKSPSTLPCEETQLTTARNPTPRHSQNPLCESEPSPHPCVPRTARVLHVQQAATVVAPCVGVSYSRSASRQVAHSRSTMKLFHNVREAPLDGTGLLTVVLGLW